jgi:ABC-type branched-subunit amino acid transport system substrate-binding protein
MSARTLVVACLTALGIAAHAAEPAQKPGVSVAAASPAAPRGGGATPFRIGNSGPSSGANSATMIELLAGAKLYFDAVNAEGGVKGRKVQLIQMDDNFEVARTVQNVEKMIGEKRVDALLLVRGTPHNEAILPLIDRAGVPLIAPSTGAMVLHQPVKPLVFNVRTAYRTEAQKLAAVLASTGRKRVAIVHVADSFGEDVAQGLLAGLAERKLTAVTVLKFDRKAVDIERTAAEVKRADADTIVLVGAGQAVVAGIQALRAMDVKVPIATLSNNASSGFVKALGDHARGIMVTQVFPDERLGTMPLTREASELARKANVPLTPAMMEGFAAAKVTVEALRRCPGACSRPDLVKSLDALDMDLGGMKLAYSPTNHTGLDFTDLSIIDRNGAFRR